jgi:hypothetical protein
MKKSIFCLLAIAVAVATFQSCKKDDIKQEDSVIATAEDLSASEDYTEQVDLDIDISIEERGGGGCPEITFAAPEGTWPNTITIDYGTACTRPDGRVLRGKIIVQQTDDIRTPGAVRTLTHDNFYIDDIKVEGTRVWTNNGQNASGQWTFTKTATDMKLTFEDGKSSTWNKTRTSVLIEGGDTATHYDDVWSSTGSASGVNRNGSDFTATITKPLIKRADCRWLSEGIIDMTVGTRTRTLDFGDGTCDRFGNVTLANGDTYIVRLRR